VPLSYALKPTAISRHLGDKHKTPIELRKQVDQYVKEFPFTYDHATIPLPINGLAPQPIIPIVDGFACQDCPYKTPSRDANEKHGNKAHSKKRVADEELFHSVRLQSWFGEKRERYWVVGESTQNEQNRQAQRVMTRDAGEESDDPGAHSNGSPDSDEVYLLHDADSAQGGLGG
jgi:hypothetical protein